MPKGIYKHKPHSQVAKDKMSAAWTPERKIAQSARMMGNQIAVWTPEEKAAQSAKMMGNQIALGYKHSNEANAKNSAIHKRLAQTPKGQADLAKAAAAARRAKPTKLEKALYKMIEAYGWKYLIEVPFPPYIVDAYVPGCHLALEADGRFHFEGNPFTGTTSEQEIRKTKERDAYLLKEYGLEVWHFTKADLKEYEKSKMGILLA